MTSLRPSPHSPAKLRTYLRVHETRLEHLRSAGFVQDDFLRYELGPDRFRIVGEIACLGNILIRVDETLAILDGQGLDVTVQTVLYAYNASVRGHGNLLRYDNAHPHPGHPDDHHRHEFDWRTSRHRLNSPSWVGFLDSPTLAEFIEEVQAWYWQHRAELPEPDAVPELGRYDFSGPTQGQAD